ncbi:MAG: PhzF family phenazine biosynthesis protein [Saprospirales bacterium]|nr:PhzF family phenazine biosynthesis protein [Saprospirales bacterium]
MQSIPIFQVDAFAERPFTGNPAAVCLLDHWPDDTLLQQIAMENNLSETAYLVQKGDGWEIRWFTPALEVDLCGHATLASAHVLFAYKNYPGERIVFSTRVHGDLSVVRKGENAYCMDFPADQIQKTTAPDGLATALGIEPLEVWSGREDLLVVLGSQEEVENLTPDFRTLGTIAKRRGVLATAPGRDHDFVSRCFFPQYGIDEDPVTGSAHTTLAPYWGKRLGKTLLHARQISHRGGYVLCELKGDRVELTGKAVTFMVGMIEMKK